MNIFKFGGASLKKSEYIKQVSDIIQKNQSDKLLVVVSAMDKTTNLLEDILYRYLQHKEYQKEIDQLKKFHFQICQELSIPIESQLNRLFQELEIAVSQLIEKNQLYDRVICYGEILSSVIVSAYLNLKGINIKWLDAREYIQTNSVFREASVDWNTTTQKIITLAHSNETRFITQGFIGCTANGEPTTLGREGSDFSAAIFGSCLNAQSVTIWKDVPGVMSADPKRIPNAVIYDELPYKEAAEMTYYGASVIHPKTIKPLANKNIPLWVKCFLDPTLYGTKIHACTPKALSPYIVYKENQCLISCRVLDYTFINEAQIEYIFKALTRFNIRINVMQNSAISFSFCFDFREDIVAELITYLKQTFDIYYNTNLTLITVKNYDPQTATKFKNMKEVVLEQSSRSTLQLIIKK